MVKKYYPIIKQWDNYYFSQHSRKKNKIRHYISLEVPYCKNKKRQYDRNKIM